jgi:membrane associated rhomboid family serine protease
MTFPLLSPLSWVAIAIMVLGLAAALSKRFVATGALMVANGAVFVLSMVAPAATGRFADVTEVQADLGLFVPSLLALEPAGLLQSFTSMFVHADLFHIVGNMIFLWAFGMPFEERIGPRRFVAIYLVSGAVGTLGQVAVDVGTGGPPGFMMGASGAIFGIMCAFAAKYPNQVIAVPVPLLFLFLRFPMRVVFGALLWVGYNIVYAWLAVPGDRTAYMAHLGGGLGGALMAVVLLRPGVSLPGQKGPIAIDLQALGDFAHDPPTRQVLAHMQQNHDEPDVFQAWLDRFFRTATCPTCKHRVMPRHRGEVVCTQGHTFDVRQDRRDKLAPTA